MFFLLSFCLRGDVLSAVVKGSDGSELVFKWVTGVKKKVPVCVGGCPINFNCEASVTVQEWESVVGSVQLP